MKKYSTSLFMLALLISCITENVFGQAPNIKLGRITVKELQQKTYPKDTSAGAVVLFRKGYFNANTFEFTYFTRIKILKPSGLDYANQAFFTPSKSDIKGYTYNLSPSNEIIKEKLDASSIYRNELVEDVILLKAFLPNVKVGSVIDISFTHIGLPFQWNFQDFIPTVWSELKIESVPDFNYSKTLFGFENLYLNEKNHWIAKDMPALKPEPYMNSLDNYLTKFEFNVTGRRIRGRYLNLTGTWDAINKRLNESERFGKKLVGGSFLNSIADSINTFSGTDFEKISKAVAHVQQHIVWDGSTSLQATGDLTSKYKKTLRGSSADINLCLILLLKKVGLEVYPAALSTRENGLLSPVYPSLSKLNNVVAAVKTGDEWLLVDASELNAPLGMLPVRCLNLQGRIIDKDLGEWISLEPSHSYTKNSYALISVKDNNEVDIDLTISHDGYAALEQRNGRISTDYEQLRKSKLESTHSVLINTYEVSGLDTPDKPFKEQLKLQQASGSSGDYILINPIIDQHFTRNPFFLGDRKYPLDFIYPISESYKATVIIPAGYEVETLPESSTIVLPDNAGKFTYKIGHDNNVLQVKFAFELNQFMFSSDQYQEVKHFIDLYLSAVSSPIVLKRSRPMVTSKK